MISPKIFSLFILSFFFINHCQVSAAEFKQSPSSFEITANLRVESTVVCGAHIDWGDGTEVQKIRVGKDVPYDFSITHTYPALGEFRFSVKGGSVWRGLRSATPCTGLEISETIKIDDPIERKITKLKVDLKSMAPVAICEARFGENSEYIPDWAKNLYEEHTRDNAIDCDAIFASIKKEEDAKELEMQQRRDAEAKAKVEFLEKQKLERQNQERLRRETLAKTPGFRDLKPGMLLKDVNKFCKNASLFSLFMSCYELDMTFRFLDEKADELLYLPQERTWMNLISLRRDVGSHQLVGIVQVSPGAYFGSPYGLNLDSLTDNPYHNTLKALRKKYREDYRFLEQDLRSFNAGRTDELMHAFEGGTILLVLRRGAPGRNEFPVLIEYRSQRLAEDIMRLLKPKKAKTQDF